MMKKLILLALTGLLIQSCGKSSDSPNTQAPGVPPAPLPQEPGKGGTESTFFAGLDSSIDAKASGQKFVAERFTILMSRLSVFALICDFKNTQGYSASFSRLYNNSTEMQANSQQAYGSEKAAYNRFEKQRNVESNRLSFQSGPNACAEGLGYFSRLVGTSPGDLATQLKTAPRGSI